MDMQPYASVGPVRFGMSETEVRAVLGAPQSPRKDGSGDLVLRYGYLRVTVGVSGAVEVGVVPEIPTTHAGIDIFSSPSAFAGLCLMDGAPQESSGFIILLKLGITMTGFHDGDESQKAVTAFVAGRWDVFKPEMKPFSLVRYRRGQASSSKGGG